MTGCCANTPQREGLPNGLAFAGGRRGGRPWYGAIAAAFGHAPTQQVQAEDSSQRQVGLREYGCQCIQGCQREVFDSLQQGVCIQDISHTTAAGQHAHLQARKVDAYQTKNPQGKTPSMPLRNSSVPEKPWRKAACEKPGNGHYKEAALHHNRAGTHHHEEIECATNDVKAGVFEAKQVQVLAPNPKRLLRGRVHRCTFELAATAADCSAIHLQLANRQLTCASTRTSQLSTGQATGVPHLHAMVHHASVHNLTGNLDAANGSCCNDPKNNCLISRKLGGESSRFISRMSFI